MNCCWNSNPFIHELSTNDIMEGDNDILKVWYLFYQWAGYWKGHKVGIRTGNFNINIYKKKFCAPLLGASVVSLLSINNKNKINKPYVKKKYPSRNDL